MNFFKLYMGDYQRDTGALSIAEHGAYFLMLQYHYATEKPLPTGKDLYRLLRCSTKADRDAVDTVAHGFWKMTPEGLVNERAEREIAIAQEMEGGAEDRRKNERDRQRRHRERRKQMYDALRARGVTPPFDATTEELQALLNADGHVTVTRDVTPPATANQTPDTITRTSKTNTPPNKRAVSLPEDFTISDRVRAWATAKGFDHLEKRLEHFAGYARANAKKYADWDQAFMNAIRDDWAKLALAKPDYSAVIATLEDGV